MKHLSQAEIFEKLLCVEFGYKQCEKGNNIQFAKEEVADEKRKAKPVSA